MSVGKYGKSFIEPSKTKPKEKYLFDAVCLLRKYFIYLTGKPKWGLITFLIKPYYKGKSEDLGYNELASWWHHRRKDYELVDTERMFLLNYNFYKRFAKVIKKGTKRFLTVEELKSFIEDSGGSCSIIQGMPHSG